ncbi:phage tail assembly chaperone [Rugamonas aquatica]|uniref:Tail assembly chaperone n=1 Tax=Rugamonas aquatica TaxID=2743357 RepID=A0A6A7N214_9BURK|nr:phage tail assembly chaperone [Rugamonas aquatica]MQA39036.1 hypothetical protein [Rugamonas aquatica]
MSTAKVTLGNAPKSFKKSVSIVLLSGSLASIDINYIYRTRSQFATLIDEKIKADVAAEDAVVAAAKAAAADAEQSKGAAAPSEPVSRPPAKTVAEWFKEADEGGAKFVLKIADGWDLDDPFNEKSLLQLEDENPGALAAIAAMYRQSVAEVRVKNS